MAGPWIRVVSPGFGLAGLTWDALTDRLQRMGNVGRNGYPPSVIRATFQEAVRRHIMTAEEAAAGVAICLRVPLERHTLGGYNVEFQGARPARAGEDY